MKKEKLYMIDKKSESIFILRNITINPKVYYNYILY